jgi:hypothetical protein
MPDVEAVLADIEAVASHDRHAADALARWADRRAAGLEESERARIRSRLARFLWREPSADAERYAELRLALEAVDQQLALAIPTPPPAPRPPRRVAITVAVLVVPPLVLCLVLAVLLGSAELAVLITAAVSVLIWLPAAVGLLQLVLAALDSRYAARSARREEALRDGRAIAALQSDAASVRQRILEGEEGAWLRSFVVAHPAAAFASVTASRSGSYR